MKIVVLTPMYQLEKNSKLQHDSSCIHYFTREWVLMDNEVYVIHLYNHKPNELINITNVFKNKIYKLKMDGVNYIRIENLRFIPKSDFIFPFSKIKMIKYIDNILIKLKDIDCIISHIPTRYLDVLEYISKKYDYPMISVLHDTDIKKMKNFNTRKRFSKLMFRNIGFRSELIKMNYCKLFNINLNNNIGFLVNSGVPFLEIKRNEFTYNKSKLMYAGKISYNKNIHTTLSVLSKIKVKYNFNFEVIGDEVKHFVFKKNSYLSFLKKIVKDNEMDNYVEFKSSVTREELLTIMKNHDIFIMPSLHESFGLVYVEAMSCGCIVIASNKSAMINIIKNGENGFLVDPENADELYNILEYIFELNKNKIIKLKKNAYLTASKFTEFNVALDYLENIKGSVYDGKK